MSHIIIGAAQTAHEAFRNWILPYAVVAIGILVVATVSVLVIIANWKKNGND